MWATVICQASYSNVVAVKRLSICFTIILLWPIYWRFQKESWLWSQSVENVVLVIFGTSGFSGSYWFCEAFHFSILLANLQQSKFNVYFFFPCAFDGPTMRLEALTFKSGPIAFQNGEYEGFMNMKDLCIRFSVLFWPCNGIHLVRKGYFLSSPKCGVPKYSFFLKTP